MEGYQHLDVPITEQEQDFRDRRSEDEPEGRETLPTENTQRLLQDDGIQPTLGRFHSLQNSARPGDEPNYTNPNYTIDGPVVHHQRIPSDATNLPQKVFNFHQQTGYDTSIAYNRLTYPPDLWTPFWTRQSTVAVFLCLYLIIIVALVLLWHFSQSLNGFDISSSTKYYAWTYAPVAFMVIVVGLWKPIDYYIKLLAPWDQLRVGPVPASESLLLDYVSPINIVAFFYAFKRGYIPVVLSTTVFFALQVTLVFSAALFFYQPTIVASNSTAALQSTAFGASSSNPSTFPNVSTFTSVPVYATIGNLIYGLPFEPGVGADHAFLPVNLELGANTDLENATYTAQTQAFLPNLSCQALPVTIAGSGAVVRANRKTVNTTSNSLSLQLPNGTACSNWIQPTVYAMNPQKEKTPSRQIEGTMQPVHCAGNSDPESSFLEPVGLLFTLTDIRYQQLVFSNGTISDSVRNVSGLTNLLCTPSYQIRDAQVSNYSALYGIDAVEIEISNAGNTTIGQLSNRNLAVLYDGILNASQGVFGTRQQNTLAATIPNTVFDLMAMTVNQTGLEPFFDSVAMQTAATATFQRVMSHYAAKSLTTTSQTKAYASSSYLRPKLHVNLLPFYIMAGCIGLCVVCTAGLLKLTPGPRVPKDPSMLAMSAAVMARSPELNRLFRNQAFSEVPMATALSGHEFSSAIAITEHGQSSFKLVVTEAPSAQQFSSRRTSSKWWSPNAWILPTVFVAVAIPIVLIAVLEVLQHRSDRDQGLATANFGPYVAMYSRCIPVLVVLLIAATVGFLNFYVALMSPWNKLASGNSRASRTLLSHLLGKLPANALIEAIRKRHTGALFSISATVVASMFAIVASGLYTVENVTSAGSPQQLLPTNMLRLQNDYSVLNDRGAAGMTGWLGVTDTSYTAGTYDNLAFSNYDLTQAEIFANATTKYQNGPLAVVIPAYRANLSCQMIPDGGSIIQRVPATRFYNTEYLRIDSHYPLPPACQLGGIRGNLPSASFQNRFNITTNRTTLYGGQLLDLTFGPNSNFVNHYAEKAAAAVGNTPPIGCPSLAFTFVEYNVSSRHAAVTAMYCYQQVQQLDVNVTYKQNSSEIDLANPPAVINSSISTVWNPTSLLNSSEYPSDSFNWRIQLNIQRQLYGLNGQTLQSGNSSTTYQFDAFFSYLFSSIYTQDPATLVGSSNQQALQDVINTLYSRYMAQAMSGNMRVPVVMTSDNNRKRQSVPGTIPIPTTIIRSRLVQDKTSKIVLESLLGACALFCTLAYILVGFHRVIPHNPSSIAGTMSLFAGSDMCWSPEDNLCDCCGRPRRSSWSHEPARPNEEQISTDPGRYQNGVNAHVTRTARDQMIVHGAEWMRYDLFESVFSQRTYSLGWWREDRAKARRRRFGVDVGSHPDDDTEEEWELGHHREPENNGLGDLVTRGRDMVGDHRGRYERAPRGDVDPTPLPDMEERNISPMQALEHWSSPTLAVSSTTSVGRKLSPLSRRTPTPEIHRKPVPPPVSPQSPPPAHQISPHRSSPTMGRQSSPTLGQPPAASPPPPLPTVSSSTLLQELRTPTSPRRVRFEDNT